MKSPHGSPLLEFFVGNVELLGLGGSGRVVESCTQYWRCYQQLRSDGKLGELDDGDMGCFSCHDCLVNVVANPHRDNGDVMRGVVVTCPSGPFKKGGEVDFLELGLGFDQ